MCSSCVRSGRNPDRVAAGRAARAADRQAADLLRRRDVAVEQRRRQIADRHVVEAVAGLVGRQQRRDVDVEREQIADGVLVFGSGQPPDRGGAAGIRMRRGRAIERRLERRDHARRTSRRPAAALPTGGICRARSFRTTFSQTSGCRATSCAAIASSASSAFLWSSSWHDRQYSSTRAR